MVLDFGGDDITKFLHALLSRNNFPYKEADMTRWHDFTVLDELKERIVVLGEVRATPYLYASSLNVPSTDSVHGLAVGGRRTQPVRLLRARARQADAEVRDEMLR